MTLLLNSDGKPAEFRLEYDGGGVVIGHLDLTTLPSGALAPGTRCSDLTFLVSEVKAQPTQHALDALRGTV